MKTFQQFYEEKQKGVDGKACWKGYKRMGTKKKGGKTRKMKITKKRRNRSTYKKYHINPIFFTNSFTYFS